MNYGINLVICGIKTHDLWYKLMMCGIKTHDLW